MELGFRCFSWRIWVWALATRVRQFRIFLSSPGDVAEERDIARDLIKDVLPYSPFIRGRAAFDVVSWDDPHAAPGLDAHLTPQEAINRQLPKPSECDIVIVILWSRMGTPLPDNITKAGGSACQSGTEWEFLDGASGTGVTLLFRRTEEPVIGARDPKLQEKLAQLEKVDAFFEQFRQADGSLSGSVAAYETVDGFRTLLRQNLESVFSGLLGDAFCEELGVTKAAVETMLTILKEQEVSPEQLEAKLKEIAERHVALTERLHELSRSNDEPEVAQKREQAAEAIERGDYDRAEALLAEAVAIDRSAIGEQQEALDHRKLSAAATIGQQGALEKTRLNYRKAAAYFAEAAGLVQDVDADARLSYLMKQASVLDDHGSEFGDNLALVKAIEVYRVVLEERPRDCVPLDWAVTQNNLGNALWTLGARDSGPLRLEEAVSAYRSALEEYTRDRVPLDWAKTQNNLGAALSTLGVRESGPLRLEEAVTAYRSALEEQTRDHVPLDWAAIQNNLGTALQTLGARESGPLRLEEAVTAYRSALEERVRDRVPLDWAKTQNNLRTALSTLGARESGTLRLEEAVSAYRAALEELMRDRVPLDWAMTQNNLGETLKILGERTCRKDQLDAALEAVRNAAEVFLDEAGMMHHEDAFKQRIAEIEAAITRLS